MIAVAVAARLVVVGGGGGGEFSLSVKMDLKIIMCASVNHETRGTEENEKREEPLFVLNSVHHSR